MACAPSPASPTTVMSGSSSMTRRNARRTRAWSSTNSSRIFRAARLRFDALAAEPALLSAADLFRALRGPMHYSLGRNVRRSYHRASHEGLHQVAELVRVVFVSFDIRGKVAIAINEDGVERMDHHALIRPKTESEGVAYLFDIRDGAAQKPPALRINVPSFAILGHFFRGIVRGVEGERQQ